MEEYLVAILFGSFFALLLLGAPITVSLAGSAMLAFIALDKNPIAFVQIAFTSVGSFPLMALPAFVLAGALMEAAGISKRWPACSSAPSPAPAPPPRLRSAC